MSDSIRPTRLWRLVAVLFALALVAAGCGSDDDDTTAEEPAAEEPAAEEPAAEEPAAEEPAAEEPAELSGLELAQARIAEFRKDVASVGLDETTEAPAGLNIVYVQCSVPVCESIRGGVAAAADAIGADFEAITHQDTPDTVQAAFQSAIQAEPDMVMTSGNPREWFEDELAQLNDAGIPVVAWSIPEPYETQGIAANLITGDDYYFNGVLMADYVTAESDGDANVLFLNIPQFPVLGLEGEGFETEYAEVCAGCSLVSFEITVEQLLAGEHIATAISELQKDPDINFIVTGFGDMLIGMPEALADAGLADNVRAVSQAGTAFNYGFIVSGDLQVADLGLPTEYLGWRAVDAGLRVLNGQNVGAFEPRPLTDIAGHPDIQIAGIPYQILEVGVIVDPTVAWPGVDGYQEAFSELWGVG